MGWACRVLQVARTLSVEMRAPGAMGSTGGLARLGQGSREAS